MKPEVHDEWVSKCCTIATFKWFYDKHAIIFVFINFVIFGFQSQSLAILPLKRCVLVDDCTRRRFGGRSTIVWYREFTSRIAVLQDQQLKGARIADSRPEPGRFNSYFNRFRSPCSPRQLCGSFWCHLSNKWCRFTRTFKSSAPADDQAFALPCTSVIITIVLLNVAEYEQYQIGNILFTTFTC